MSERFETHNKIALYKYSSLNCKPFPCFAHSHRTRVVLPIPTWIPRDPWEFPIDSSLLYIGLQKSETVRWRTLPGECWIFGWWRWRSWWQGWRRPPHRSRRKCSDQRCRIFLATSYCTNSSWQQLTGCIQRSGYITEPKIGYWSLFVL